jgi:glutamate--cysteine ligase
LSYRSRVWDEVDPTRCGYLPAFFDGSFCYRAYVEWALDAPLLFLRRQGQYLRPKLTFRELLAKGFQGQPALYSDWVDHLSTLFPEVRLKKVLEVRGADCVDAELTGALVALWRGLLYDPTAREEAARLLPALTHAEHLAFHETARKQGLKGQLRGTSLASLASGMLEVARAGLMRLDRQDAPLLAPLEAVAASGSSPAERVLAAREQLEEPAKVLAAFAL